MNRWILPIAVALGLSGIPAQAQDVTIETYKALSTFGEVYNLIRMNSVQPHNVDGLINQSIHGMVQALDDKYASYVSPEDAAKFREQSSDSYSGIGAEVSWDEETKGVIIELPMEGSPAIRAGLKPGDIIIEIDGESIQDMNLRQAIEKIKGPTNSIVSFTILREGVNLPIEVVRGKIKRKTVRARMIDDVIYARLTQFNHNSARELAASIVALLTENEDAKGLILDLRNNGGGLLIEAIEINDMFLDEGLTVETRSRNEDESYKTFAESGQIIPNDMKMVVLVNGFSASASEIVAGTLKDLDRAIIIGTQSFGKGSVQSVIPLSNGGIIKFTTAKYYTAGGTSPDGVGIAPDAIVEVPDAYWEGIPIRERRTNIDPQLEAAILVIGNSRNASCDFSIVLTPALGPDQVDLYTLHKSCPDGPDAPQ